MGSCPDTDIDPKFLSQTLSAVLFLQELTIIFFIGLQIHYRIIT